MKNSKETGITLIALIITIIVLLILAGVSISMLVGDNGILSQAVNATVATDVADTKEQIQVALVGYLDSNGDYTEKNVLSAVQDVLGDDASITENEDGTYTTTTAKGNTVDLTDLISGAKQVYWYYADSTHITNGSVTLAIGDYVDYDPGDYTYTSDEDVNGYGDQVFNTSSYKYGWRVLGVDEDTGELLIISEDLIGPDSGGSTNSTYNRTYFKLKGQAGYANCESELNSICAIYGNGYGATGARSINVDDINKITGYDPETAGYGSGNIGAYGNEVTYTYNGSASTAYDDGNGHSGTYAYSFTYYTGTAWKTLASGEDVTLTSTYYYYYPNTLTTSSSGDTVGISTTSTEYYMLFTNSSTGAYSSGANSTTGFYYWLASPCVSCGAGSANFYCRYVYGGYVSLSYLCVSSGSANDVYRGVRAAVSLSSDISLSEGSDSVWTIN